MTLRRGVSLLHPKSGKTAGGRRVFETRIQRLTFSSEARVHLIKIGARAAIFRLFPPVTKSFLQPKLLYRTQEHLHRSQTLLEGADLPSSDFRDDPTAPPTNPVENRQLNQWFSKCGPRAVAPGNLLETPVRPDPQACGG